MPKFPRSPRVSIVIPLQRDERLFEETLLSVLENQTDDCQIVVAHNGTYSDPFQIGDEVDFVTARSSNLVDLIRDAFDATAAPIVHVLGTGMKATAGWLGDALEAFRDDEIGAVTPALVDGQATEIGAGGWSDGRAVFCQPSVGNSDASSLHGFYLHSFLIRRHLLGDLLDALAPAMNDPVEVAYAMGCLLDRAQWKVMATEQCMIEASDALPLDDRSDMNRGQRLAAIRTCILPNRSMPTVAQMLIAAITGPSSPGEMIGMMRRHRSLSAMRRAIDPECVSKAHAIGDVFGDSATTTRDQRQAA